MKRTLFSLFCLGVAMSIGCHHSSRPSLLPKPVLPDGVQIAVVTFRDCMIAGQEDCGGSGESAGAVFATELNDPPHFTAVPLSRPVGATDSLSDDAAVALAKTKDYAYVLNGDVLDYYRVSPMIFREERAAVSVRLLRVSDGKVMAFYSKRGSQNSFSSPEKVLKDLADEFRDQLEGNQ